MIYAAANEPSRGLRRPASDARSAIRDARLNDWRVPLVVIFSVPTVAAAAAAASSLTCPLLTCSGITRHAYQVARR